MAEQLFMIALSPTMEEGTIAQWTKKVGEQVKNGDVICEVETDKATMDYESSQEGTLLAIIVEAGKQAKVGDVIGILGTSGESWDHLLGAAKTQPKTSSAPTPGPTTPGPIANQASTAVKTSAPLATPSAAVSPLARKIASEKGIDLKTIQGSGPGGRIIKRDLEDVGSPQVHSTIQAPGEDTIIPVKGVRAVIARRLSESLFSAPHFFVKKTITVDAVFQARQALNKDLPAANRISFNAFLIKFCASALQRCPEINASWQGDSIRQFASIDIGLAVDLGNGLVTPIIRNAGSKGIRRIDEELKELINKASTGTLKPEEYTGATFTISNLGSFGVDEFTAIINPPGSAILAVGQANKQAVVTESGELGIANRLTLTMSYDHRVIDGSAGAKFIGELAAMLEAPIRALF